MPVSEDEFIEADYPAVGADKSPSCVMFSDSKRTPSFVQWLSENEVRNADILLSEGVWKELNEVFPLNAKFTSLVADMNLHIRVGDCSMPFLFLTPQTDIVLGINLSGMLRFLPVADEISTEQIVTDFQSTFADAREVTIDVPPWNELLEQLEEMVGMDTKEEYRRLINAAASSNLNSLDEVSVALIAAALSGALNYDISSWGEEMNVASKATFSRRKKELEQQGVIVTERVPVDVGRPRQRLHLDTGATGVDLDIGVDNKEIGIPEQQESQQNEKQSPEPTTDDAGSESQKSTPRTDSPGDFIDILNEELREVIAEDSES